jgi:hypothetical protein
LLKAVQFLIIIPVWTFSVQPAMVSFFVRYRTSMNKLPEVERAKALLSSAMSWSVMKWLREKKRARKTADEANAALDQMCQALKERWSAEARLAYQEFAAQADKPGGNPGHEGKADPPAIEPRVLLLIKAVKKADEAAFHARMDAEQTFDEAERQLSTSLAREGCRKAIYSWELYEKAIAKAEAVTGPLK